VVIAAKVAAGIALMGIIQKQINAIRTLSFGMILDNFKV
tara:strand:- start:673 stop:789 length:117 start_codon:yes stop_codon:yes gene_type:complete